MIKHFILICIIAVNFSNVAACAPVSTIDNTVFSRDKSKLIFTDIDATKITAINAVTGKIIKEVAFTLPKGALLLDATPDGFKVLYLDKKGLSVVHNQTGKVLRTLAHPKGNYRATSRRKLMVQNTNGSLIAIPYTRGLEATIFTLHTGHGRVINQISLPRLQQPRQSPINAIGFSNNNRLLAYTRLHRHQNQIGSMLHIYDLFAKKEIKHIFLPNHHDQARNNTNRLQFSPDDKSLLLVLSNRITVIDYKKESVKDYPNPLLFDAVFAKGGRSLIVSTGTNNPKIKAVDLQSGSTQNIRLKFPVVGKAEHFVQSMDKSLLALPFSGTKNGFLLLNGQTGQEVRQLQLN